MLNVIKALKSAAAKRAAYLRTRNEIAGLSDAEVADLGIYRQDAARIARAAVYGH